MKDYVIVRYANFAPPGQPAEIEQCLLLRSKRKREAAADALDIFAANLEDGDELGSVCVIRAKRKTWFDPVIRAVKSALQCCGGLASIGTWSQPNRHAATCEHSEEDE